MAGVRKLLLAISIGAGLALAGAGAASAATTPCTGKAPAGAAAVHGPVLEVIDGETLCVALGATPDRWVALKLAGLPQARRSPGETVDRSRGALMAVAFSQNVTCRVIAASAAETAAVCDLDGRSIVARVRESRAMRLGMAWR